MDKPRRNSGGRSAGRSSDRNSKDSSPKPARGSSARGTGEGKFDKKPFDKGPKKPFGKSDSAGADKRAPKPYGSKEGYGDKKPAGRSPRTDDRPSRPYGDKKFDDRPARSGDRPSKPYGDKKFDDRPPRSSDRPSKPYGDKKFGDKPARSNDRPAKPYGDKKFGDKPARSNDRPARPYGDKPSFSDKPAGRGGAKSSYKSYEEKGKLSSRGKSSEREESHDDDTAKKPVKAPKTDKAFKEKGTDTDRTGKSRPRLDETKKSTSKYQARKDLLGKEGSKKTTEKSADNGLPQSGIRLNKFIANSGMCSRREADVMITNGVVTVNGKVLDELGYRVQPDDVVKFDGRTIIPEKPVYVLLNKPKDYITTSEDPQGRRTVMALIEGACKERVFPVGRLDRNTTGLLLFTNDGEMADKLMHPRKRVKKIYMAELDKNFKHEHLQQLRDGVTLEDGPIRPDVVEYAELPKPDKKVIGVEIHSGRNRIVRRMFEHFGYKVVKLDRVYYAGLTKKNLPRGQYRILDTMEVNMLKML